MVYYISNTTVKDSKAALILIVDAILWILSSYKCHNTALILIFDTIEWIL